MSVYAICLVIARERTDGNTDVKPFMQVVTMVDPSTVLDAVEFVRLNFIKTVPAAEGWHLQGDPVLFEFHQGLVKEWEIYIAPAPQTVTPRDHLKVVK